MANVFNNSTNKWEDISDSDLPSALVSGSHSLPKNVDVPMVDRDGSPISIPSENAAEAFRRGYQLSTPQTADAAYQKASDQAVQQRMGETGASTFGMNALGAATGGVTDVIPRVILGPDYAKARTQGQEANPVASALGTGVGIAGGMFTGGAEAEGATAAESLLGGFSRSATSIGKSAEGAAAKAFGESALGTAASKAIGSAAEGAYFGLGTGISEAALGDPNEVVDNIISNVGMGGLIGGAGSLAFGAANAGKSVFQKITTDAIDKASDVVNAAARGSGKTALTAALAARGESALAPEATSLLDKGVLDGLDNPKVAEGQQELSKVSEAETALNTQLKRQSSAVSEEVKQLTTQDSKDAVNSAIVAADGDAQKALEGMNTSYIQGNDEFRKYRMQELSDKPAVMANDARSLIKSTVDQLKEIAVTGQEKRFVNELYSAGDAQFGMPSNHLDGAFIDRAPMMADELEGAKSVRELVGNRSNFSPNSPLMKNTSNEFREVIKENFLPKLNQMFETQYPDKFAGQYMKDMRQWYDGIGALSKAVKTSGAGGLGDLISTKAGDVLGKISDFAPDLEAARKAAGNASKLEDINQQAYQKLKDIKINRGELGQSLSYDDFKSIMKDLTPTTSLSGRMDRLKQTQDLINSTQNLSPIDKAIQIKRALGHDVSNLEALQPHMAALDALSKLQNLKIEGTSRLGRTGAMVGGIVGGGPGATALGTSGKAASALINTYRDPARIVRGVQAVQKMSDMGAKFLDKNIKRATDALLGKTVETAAKRVATTESSVERRKKYENARTKLAELQNPQSFADHVAGSMSNVEGTPAIKAAAQTRLRAGVSYLNQQLPQDPMAGTSILVNKSNFTPSDATVSKFTRQLDAVSNPMSVVDRISNGRVSLDEIQALKAVHPAIYNKLQASVINGIMEHGEKIPYERRLQIGQLFNTPTDYSMQPQFIASMQQNFANTDGGRPDNSQDTTQRKPRLDTDRMMSKYQTMSDSLAYKTDND